MTNFLVLLAIGGTLGWLASVLRRHAGQNALLANIMAGAAASFAAGLTANGDGLYAGLSGFGYAGAVAGAVCALSLLELLRNRCPR